MKYGIEEKENIVKCANCGRIISKDGNYKDNFCYHCGNPLKLDAIDTKENEIQDIRAEVIESLKKKILEEKLIKESKLNELLEDIK